MMSELVQRRNAKGLSQAAFAGVADVSVSTVANFEAGRCRPSPRIRRKLALAYGCTMEEVDQAAANYTHEAQRTTAA